MKPWQIDWDTDVAEGGAMPWEMELEVEAGSERAERKRSAGEVATDVGKSLGGSVVSAVGAIPKAAGRALQMGGDEEQPLSMDEARRRSGADGTNALDDTKALLEFERTNRVSALDVIGRGVEWLGDKTMDAGQAIRDSRSDEAKRLAEQSTPSGDLTKPSTWSMGEDPSIEGLTHVGADVVGSMAPVVGSAVATRGRSVATQMLTGGATVGAQVGGSAMTEARDYLAAMDDEVLFEASPVFRELIEQKNTPEQARAILTRRAENTAAAYAAPVGMVGGQATGALLGKAGEKLASVVPGITGKALVLGVLGASEEAVQEVAEGVATRAGINDAAGTDRSLTEGTFAEAVLGAKGGGAVGAGRGALAGLAQRQAPGEVDQVEPVRGDDGREAAAVQASVQPQSPVVEPPAGNERQLFDTPAPAANRLQGPPSPDTQQGGVRLAELEIAAQSRELAPWEEAERSELADRLESEERPPESAPRSGGEPSTATQPSRASTDQVLPAPPASREVQGEGRAVAVQPVPSEADVDSGAPDAFQNRDRSRAASVAQMADIARDPDYMRLATSRTPDAGAPMVFAVGDSMLKVLAENGGKVDVAVMSDGQRVPFRYAVVDASTVEPSNFVDGRANPAYGADVIGSLKALNNGRTAGLRAAYQEGTAERYQAELIADAEAHGVPVEAIRRTPNPILVRLYSEGSNTPDMAAKSQGQGLGMSPAELATQDAGLIDTSALSILQPGDISSAANRDFVRSFVGRLQQSGQDVASFMTAEGTLSPAGRQRMQAALMQAAYEDVELVGELFDSLDTDIKSIGEALKAVAGEWASMRDSARQGLINPEVDITDNLVQAINLIRKARRDRISLYDLTRQPDLMTGDVPDPITVGALRMFYGGSYFVRPLGREAMIGMLRDYTRSAMVTTADADMFGEQVAPGQILASFENEGVSNAQDPAQNGRRLPDSGASAVSGADEGRGAEERYDGGAGGPRAGRAGRGDGKESQDAASREGRDQSDETPKTDAQAGQPRVAERPAREAGDSGKSLNAPGKKPPRTADRDFWAYAKEQGHAPKDVQVGSELHTRLKTEFEALKAGKARYKAITGKKLEGGWVEFSKASGALGVPRADMPQIKAEHRGALTQFLAARDASHQAEAELDAATLRPTQAEFSTAKVKQAQDFEGGERSILISADSYVLDGHHQWLAALAQGLPIRAIRFDAPMAELLPLAREFPSAGAEPGDMVHDGAAAAKRFPPVSSMTGLSMGPGGRIEPRPIAEGRPLYRETNTSGLDDMLRLDGQAEVVQMFVTDNPDLALGQGVNKGVRITFRPGALSGREHKKPGTGDMAGREYQTDIVAPRAVQSITMPASSIKALRGLTKRALEDFDRTNNGDGTVTFNRKGLLPGFENLNALRAEALPIARTGAFAKQGLTFEDRGESSAIMFKGQEIATMVGARNRQNIVKAIQATMDKVPATAKPAAGNNQLQTPAPSILDAGEKIGGARKDRWKERGLDTGDLDGMTEAEGAELATKANVWKPDYAAIAAAAEPVTAAMVKVVYDSLAARPKENTPQGRRDYVKAMQAVRKVYGGVRSVEEAKGAYVKLREALGVQQGAGMRALEKDSPAAIARRVMFALYKGRSDPFVLGFNELQRAKKLVEDGFPGQKEPWRTRLAVSRLTGGPGTTLRGVESYMAASAELGTPMTEEQVRAGFYRVVDKKGKSLAFAATVADAEAAARTIYERDLKGTKDGKPEPERPHLDSMTRAGLPARIDRDVTSQDFIDAFGFRGVEFGNWSAQDERQRIINMAYDGLMDLAEIIGVPPKAMSLNGTLGMAFGARGTGRALAHYEPGKLVINMTKIRGGGSLAHEWAHALDHYFGELNRQDAYQTKARGASGWMDEAQYKGIPRKRTEKVDGQWRTVEQMRLENLRPEVSEAFDNVMETLFQRKVDKAEMVREHELGIEKAQAMAAKGENAELRTMYQRRASELAKVLEDIRKDPEDTLYSGRGRTEYATEAQKLSGKSTKGYWLRPTEMFARAFESYVFDRETAMGARTDYLVHGVEADRFAGGGYKGNPYPTGVERARINAAFQKLVDTIESRETDDGKVILLSRSDDAVTGPLGVLNAIAKTDELFQLPKSGADTIEAITADINPEITVKRSPGVPGRTEYMFTMPDGKTATMTIRPRNPYGETVYGFDLQDGEMMNLVTERPGENPEGVAPDVEDVWIDVSRLKSGGDGTSVYAIASNFAHNTGRIFIGDPAGLSDQAMRRRPEQMLSSALKFGTTKHLAPQPRQVAGDAKLGIPALKWVYGDDVGNIRRLIDLNLKTLENAGLHDAINFDPSTGDYTDSTGSPIGRDGIEAGVALGLGRGAGAGGKTLARRAVLASLVRGKGQAQRGADGRSDGVLEELVRVARQFPAATEGVFYSRNLNGKAGKLPGRIGFAELKALADRLKAGAPNMPAVNVLADPSQAPRALREYINRQGAWFDVEGAMHDGELYLFASGLASAERAEHVLIEHEAAHYGLRAVLGPSLKTAMRLVYVQNASVRKAVAELQKRSNLSELVATEEVIVDIPTAELAKLKGWRKVVMAARDWLASRGYTTLAQKLTDWLDGSLTQQQRADLFVADLVRAAREYATGKGSSRALVAMGTRLSGSLAEDIAKQEAWLLREAQARGFKDIEDLLARDYSAFEKLAELWRKNNPSDSLMSRRKDQTKTPEFKAWFGDSKVVDAEGKPMVVYHGTRRDFNAFQPGKVAEVASGSDAAAELGHFFSDDLLYVDGLLEGAQNPGSFADGANIMPVYLALRNPKIEPMQKIQDLEESWSAERTRRYRKHLESLGHDGIIFNGKKSREFVVFNPEQIKSAIGNLGTFDPASQDVHLSRGQNDNGQGNTKTTEPNAWEKAKARVQDLTSPEAIDRLLYEFQDKFIDLRRMREHIKALGGTITDLNDAYLGEELYHKRLAKRTADFLDKELKPLLADMRARAIKLPDLESFLHARHAPEANRVLAERNPNRAMLEGYRREAAKAVRDLELQLQRAKAQGSATAAIEESLAIAHEEASKWTGAQAFKGTEAERLALSGMSDADAKAHMDGLSPAKLKHLEHLAEVVDRMQESTLAELESYGLMDRATLSAWRSTYEHYVPLHRDEAKAESDRHPIGQGFSVKGSGSRDRVGSNEKVTNILAHIAMQREAALTRGEKNLVVKKLYLMAAQNPDEDFWKLDAPPKIKTVDPRNGTVRTTIDPTFKHRPNVLMLRIAGRDKAIVFNEHNPSAVRLAESMKNLDIGDLHVVLGLAAKGTRWFASVNTQYNPIFGVINFARDVQAAMLQLSTTPLAGQQKVVASHVFTAMRAIYRQRRGKPARSDAWTKLWDEFEKVGGTTGYRDLFADTNDRVKALTRELKALDRGQVSKAAHAVVDWLSDYNEAMENAVRLASYKVGLDQGMTKGRAASLAKNLTVNFNRKGRQTRELGALYAFFNAALQGTTRMVETLKGPIGKRIMFGGIALGAINTLVGMAVMGGGDDDEADNWDKIPDFIKERSLIIPLGREDYVSIPMPLGFHVFPNIGRVAVEMAMSDGHKSAARQVGDLLMVLVDAFNPVGGGGNLGQMVAPTVIDPVVGLMQNLDWTGRQIYREDFSTLDPTPGHSRTKDSASTASRGLAEAINAITGGNEYRPGAWSPTPDQIDYVFGQLTGGLGRELIKANQTIASTFTGDELPPYKVPLLGRVYGNTRGPAGQSDRYYENVKLLNELENELRGRQMKREDVGAFREAEPLTDLILLGSGTQRQIQKLRTLRRREAEEAKEGYREELQRIDEQIAEAMSRLNNEVSRVRREKEGAK